MIDHVCIPESCPEPGKYFVSAADAGKVWLMAGPYLTHKEALSKVDAALKIADKHDGRAWFMSWGTVRMPDDTSEIGRLQKAGLL